MLQSDRLISANALKSAIERNFDMQDTLHDVLPSHIFDLIDEQKEAINHGKWEDVEIDSVGWIQKNIPDTEIESLKCSVCNRWQVTIVGHIPMKYCSHCGAKMDLKGDA